MNSNSGLMAALQNPVVISGLLAWFVAQSIKVILGYVRERRFNFKWFVGSGGMPSSHASLVTAVAISCSLIEGFGAPLFVLALTFAIVTMFDAQGVRHQSGKQAEALNKILDDIYSHRGVQAEPVKELFGHTPVEVLAGSVLGFVIALFVN